MIYTPEDANSTISDLPDLKSDTHAIAIWQNHQLHENLLNTKDHTQEEVVQIFNQIGVTAFTLLPIHV